jgi:ATP-dependent Clp protease ATP-binding subunit ClpA/predicted DNA-binding transcriptional regulator AlpA
MAHHLVGTAEIAEMLGVSRQRVDQLVDAYDDFPTPEVDLAGGRVWSRTAVETWIRAHPDRGPGRPEADRPAKAKGRRKILGRRGSGIFEEFTDLARKSIVKAQEEARLLKHNYIGTEHLLLGLISLGDGAARQALDALGVALEPTRDRVRRMIGEGDEAPSGHIPFTPRAKKVLELASDEADKLDHSWVGTEHILLALVEEGEGVAWQILADSGSDAGEVRQAVQWALALRLGPPRRKQWPRSQEDGGVQCSFCGKDRSDVQSCVAGPGVYICDGCVVLCLDILEETGVDVRSGARAEDRLTARIAGLEARIQELERKR